MNWMGRGQTLETVVADDRPIKAKSLRDFEKVVDPPSLEHAEFNEGARHVVVFQLPAQVFHVGQFNVEQGFVGFLAPDGIIGKTCREQDPRDGYFLTEDGLCPKNARCPDDPSVVVRVCQGDGKTRFAAEGRLPVGGPEGKSAAWAAYVR
jgi:hypothetical protein